MSIVALQFFHWMFIFMEKFLRKKLLTVLVMLFLAAGVAFAQVDVNKGDQAALDSIEGIGPKISQIIVDERNAHGAFKDWADFEKRVKGIGDKKAAALLQAGLTVNGQSMSNAPASSASASRKDASPVSTPAMATGKTGMQTDTAKNRGQRSLVLLPRTLLRRQPRRARSHRLLRKMHSQRQMHRYRPPVRRQKPRHR
jgi:competence protein ComEA